MNASREPVPPNGGPSTPARNRRDPLRRGGVPGRTDTARRAVMLQVVAPFVAEMLHLKSLIINHVAGVAGFQTMSTCNPHIKTLNINVLVCFFDGFLCITSFTPRSLGEEGGWMVEDGGQGSSSFAKATADRKVKGPEFESIFYPLGGGVHWRSFAVKGFPQKPHESY